MKESSGGVGVEEKGHHTIQKMTCETEVPKIIPGCNERHTCNILHPLTKDKLQIWQYTL